MIRAAVLGLLLVACAPERGDRSPDTWTTEEVAPPPGRLMAFRPDATPEGEMLWLLSLGDRWAVRTGERWRNGGYVTTLEVDTSDGLSLDGVRVLPSTASVGARVDDAEVVERGAHEVWYGTFPDAISVEVADATWDGLQVFSLGHGPIRLSVATGVWGLTYPSWELVGYEDDLAALEAWEAETP